MPTRPAGGHPHAWDSRCPSQLTPVASSTMALITRHLANLDRQRVRSHDGERSRSAEGAVAEPLDVLIEPALRTIHAELNRAQVAGCTVEMFMCAEGLRGFPRAKTRKTTIGDGGATERSEDLAKRKFVLPLRDGAQLNLPSSAH